MAILRTLAYADVFDYPLNTAEIHHNLIAQHATMAQVTQALAQPWLSARLDRCDDWFVLRGRSACCGIRAARAQASARLHAQARRWGTRMAALPFVRMLAITGSLAVNNAESQADIDLLIVTTPGRVWLTRALVIGLVRLARLTGVRLCPNYVLSERVLAQQRRDVYVAHDLVNMRLLYGPEVFARMHMANAWQHAHLPNAPVSGTNGLALSSAARALKHGLELALSGRIGSKLEQVEHSRKARKLRAQAHAGSAALLDADHVKGHFNDHRAPVLVAYATRLAALSLEVQP